MHEVLTDGGGKLAIGAGDVIVVTGGARGVTAAVSVAMAKAYGCGLLLLGRSAVSGSEAAWLSGVEEGQIKKRLASRMNGKGTPKALEEEFRKIVADREVRGTLKQIAATGVEVIYRSVDVRDAAAVGAIAEARANLGQIAGIIHGAGVLQDRLIEQKTGAQFEDGVFDEGGWV